MPTTHTLAELAEAQRANTVLAFELDFDEQHLARLRHTYARLRAELNTFRDLFEESALDIELRAADGRRLTLRLPVCQICDAYTGLHDALINNLRQVEYEIVNQLLHIKEEAEIVDEPQRESELPDVRPAILALCAPAPMPSGIATEPLSAAA